MTTPFSNDDGTGIDIVALADSKFQFDENEEYMNFLAQLAFESRRQNESSSVICSQGKNETN